MAQNGIVYDDSWDLLSSLVLVDGFLRHLSIVSLLRNKPGQFSINDRGSKELLVVLRNDLANCWQTVVRFGF